MITIKTGLPRNGKTLSLVTELAALFERWKKHPEETRPVFQFGVTGLTLPATLIDAWPATGKKGDPIPLRADGKPSCALAFDQDAIPDGALILIDECQDFYPVRGPSQKAPEHVAALNTHGHRNLDYIVLTQHPKLIDNAVRRLVNKHQHYRRALGGGSAITYEWDVCSDALEYQKAIKGIFSYPKKSFGLYTSASGFTRPKFKLPAFMLIPLLAIPVGVWAIPAAYSALSGAATGKGIAASVPAAPASAPVPRAPAPTPAGAASATQAAQPTVAPRAPLAAGCISSASKCMCMDREGLVLDLALDACRVAAVELGRVVPYDLTPSKSAAAEPAPARVGL